MNITTITEEPGIYKITNLSNGKMYVGSAVNPKIRIQRHIYALERRDHHSIKLQRAWLKYGSSSFTYEVIETVASQVDLVPREQYWMDICESSAKGYNVAPVAGSPLGIKRSEETRRRISEGHKGQVSWMKGLKATAEHRERLSESHKGKTLSSETKLKMSIVRKGKIVKAETKLKIAATLKGRTHSAESKQKMSETKMRKKLERCLA